MNPVHVSDNCPLSLTYRKLGPNSNLSNRLERGGDLVKSNWLGIPSYLCTVHANHSYLGLKTPGISPKPFVGVLQDCRRRLRIKSDIIRWLPPGLSS
jgi:hypothetical protein